MAGFSNDDRLDHLDPTCGRFLPLGGYLERTGSLRDILVKGDIRNKAGETGMIQLMTKS
jgi:hypothetical protein